MIPLQYYLAVSSLLFIIGGYGALTCKNGIRVLMCLEIMLNAANINLVAFSRYVANATGQVFAAFSIAIAAAEVSVGLALMILIYRLYKTVDVSKLVEMRW